MPINMPVQAFIVIKSCVKLSFFSPCIEKDKREAITVSSGRRDWLRDKENETEAEIDQDVGLSLCRQTDTIHAE